MRLAGERQVHLEGHASCGRSAPIGRRATSGGSASRVWVHLAMRRCQALGCTREAGGAVSSGHFWCWLRSWPRRALPLHRTLSIEPRGRGMGSEESTAKTVKSDRGEAGGPTLRGRAFFSPLPSQLLTAREARGSSALINFDSLRAVSTFEECGVAARRTLALQNGELTLNP
jgi:hypothetical protein